MPGAARVREAIRELAARAHGLTALDGETLIHPKTIAVANRIVAPSPEEMAWARTVVTAHAAASRATGRVSS